jgi:hypothetical protein
VPGEEFIIGNNDGEDVGVTKKQMRKFVFSLPTKFQVFTFCWC